METSHLLALLVAFLWAFPVLIQKILMVDIDIKVIFFITGIFYAITTILYGFYNIDVIKQGLDIVTYKHLILLAVISFFGSFVPNCIYYNILKDTNSALTTTLTYVSPLFIFILSYMFLDEIITVKSTLGVIIIFIGIVLLASGLAS